MLAKSYRHQRRQLTYGSLPRDNPLLSDPMVKMLSKEIDRLDTKGVPSHALKTEGGSTATPVDLDRRSHNFT